LTRNIVAKFDVNDLSFVPALLNYRCYTTYWNY